MRIYIFQSHGMTVTVLSGCVSISTATEVPPPDPPPKPATTRSILIEERLHQNDHPTFPFVLLATPESHCFKLVGYKEATQELLLSFRESGTYLFYDYPKTGFDAFLEASSLGSFFNHLIKWNYQYEKLSDTTDRFIQYLLEEDEKNRFQTEVDEERENSAGQDEVLL